LRHHCLISDNVVARPKVTVIFFTYLLPLLFFFSKLNIFLTLKFFHVQKKSKPSSNNNLCIYICIYIYIIRATKDERMKERRKERKKKESAQLKTPISNRILQACCLLHIFYSDLPTSIIIQFYLIPKKDLTCDSATDTVCLKFVRCNIEATRN